MGDPTISAQRYPYQEPGSEAAAPKLEENAANPTEVGAAAPAPTTATTTLDLLAQQVEQSGVRTVDGDVVGDDSFFLDERYGMGWGWGDLQWDYGAPVSALTFNDNETELAITGSPNAPAATAADQAASPQGPLGVAGPPVNGPAAAVGAATEAEWTPRVDYFTLDNSMTVALPGEPQHPGVECRARLNDGADVGHCARTGTARDVGRRRSSGVYGRCIQRCVDEARRQRYRKRDHSA